MARIFLKATPQIEADRNLLKFRCYEEYLDSLSTAQDTCYLQNVETSRTIANLGSIFNTAYIKMFIVFKESSTMFKNLVLQDTEVLERP